MVGPTREATGGQHLKDSNIEPKMMMIMIIVWDLTLRIDNSGWGVNSSPLFDVAGKRWYQSKYHVLYTIRQPIINSIY